MSAPPYPYTSQSTYSLPGGFTAVAPVPANVALAFRLRAASPGLTFSLKVRGGSRQTP